MPTPPRGVLALTGATGFIGARIARAAVAGGWPVRALAREPGTLAAELEPVHGDLEDEGALARLCAGADSVIHCAGSIRARDAAAFHAINATAAGRLAATAADAGVRRFIHISSLAARQPNLSAYAASKRAGERLIEQGTGPADWIVVRPPATYGPGDRATLPIFRQAARGLLVEPRRAGGRMSLLHVDDLARLILALAESDSDSARVIEPDDGAGGHGWNAIAAAAAAAAGRPSLRHVRLPYRAAWFAGAVAGAAGLALGRPALFSVGKAREAFHADWAARDGAAGVSAWRPAIALEAGFRDTLVWYREHRWL